MSSSKVIITLVHPSSTILDTYSATKHKCMYVNYFPELGIKICCKYIQNMQLVTIILCTFVRTKRMLVETTALITVLSSGSCSSEDGNNNMENEKSND